MTYKDGTPHHNRSIFLTAKGCTAVSGHTLGCVACGARAIADPDAIDHCPACRVTRELTEHRDATASEWSVRRVALNFARIVALRACPEYVPRPPNNEE